MKTYSTASTDVSNSIERMLTEYHTDLDGISIGALFVFDDEESKQVLKHNGYPALAVVKITSLRDRALGIADAVITIDRSCWQSSTAAQKDALIDHELTHLERMVDEETNAPVCDGLGRPKLSMRRHDHQIGVFLEVLERHQEASAEARQAKALFTAASQLRFEFAPAPERQAA